MAPAPATQLTCPGCKKVCELPYKVESLPTNLNKIHILKLNEIIENEIRPG